MRQKYIKIILHKYTNPYCKMFIDLMIILGSLRGSLGAYGLIEKL